MLSVCSDITCTEAPLGWHVNFAVLPAGYLVLEDFAAPDEVAKLKQRAEEIMDEYDASNPSVFSTVNQAIGG